MTTALLAATLVWLIAFTSWIIVGSLWVRRVYERLLDEGLIIPDRETDPAESVEFNLHQDFFSPTGPDPR